MPVAINGPWAAPSIYPDIAGILDNPQAAYEKLSKLGGGLVKLPSADSLGGALEQHRRYRRIGEGEGRRSIERSDQGRPGLGGQGVVQGLGQILVAASAAPSAAPPQSAAPQVEEPAKKKGKQKQAKAAGTAAKPVGSPPAQPAAVAPAKPAPKERLQHTFGAF